MNQSEHDAYWQRARTRARLIDLENAVALDEAKAAAKRAQDEREEAEWREFAAWARAAVARTPRPAPATRTAAAAMPVIRLPRGGDGRVERRMTSWYLPGGGEADR